MLDPRYQQRYKSAHMNRPSTLVAIALLAGGLLALSSSTPVAQEKNKEDGSPINIGDRRELFVDDFLIDKRTVVELRLHSPTPREIVMVRDAPWEGAGGAALTVFRDGDRFRMYYDTFLKVNEDGSNITASSDDWFMCYAESKDGIHWTRPELGLVAHRGSKKNNIVVQGNFDASVFKDPNPACPAGAQYKMVQGVMGKGLFAFKSPDGVKWSPMTEKPIIAQKPGIPMFDTQNITFWDPLRKHYWAYYRGYASGRRDIFVATSKDFATWTEGKWLDYGDSPRAANEQHYTIQVLPYPRAPHLFVGFPARYIERGWYASNLASLPDPEHRKNRMNRDRGGIGEPRLGKAHSDGLFITSRDGRTFQRWGEAFIRPGIERKTNWVYGDCFQNWGIVETRAADPFAPPEFSFYTVENYWRKPVQVRRHSMRIDGFVSLHAGARQGEVLTRPLVFAGKSLTLNFSTSAVGNIKIELLDVKSKPIPGYTLNDCDDIFGDALERVVTWVKPDVSPLAGKPVRLRIVMKDTDLYSIRFGGN
jgi:hypothetical protein